MVTDALRAERLLSLITCMYGKKKLSLQGGLAMKFLSFQIDRNYSLTLPGNVCVTGVHVTSHNQGLSSNDQARQGRETLGTRLTGVNVVLRAHVYFGQHQDMELWHNHFQNYDD